MLRKHVLIGAAACAALAFASLTRADDATTAPASAPAASAPAATVTPLNGAIANIPVLGPAIGNLGISATGYVEGSWTYSAHPPAGNILGDRVFDTKTESPQFDAVDLNLTRAVDSSKPFDIGFTIEQMYGWDGAYIHSNGLTIYGPSHTGAGGTAAIHPKAQYDLNQAFFVLSFAKVGNGLTVTGGKWDTLLGYELIDAPLNALYSHSFIFDEEPFTHTGLYATYNLTDPSGPTPFTASGGFARGWDQATRDNNGSIDYLGQLKYTVTGKYSILLNIITGDEDPSGPFDGWRTVIDSNGSYSFSDQLTLGFNGMYAWQAQTANGGAGGGTGSWYGVAGYASYKICDQLTLNARGEWFDDQDGAAPTQLSSGITNIPNQFYEVTVGLAIKPLPSDPILSGLTIRPEGRWDYSDIAAFNGGTQNDQWTGAIEAYFSF
jgi:hypothetical protein